VNSSAYLPSLLFAATATFGNTISIASVMFKRSFHSKDRAGKAVKTGKKSYRDHVKVKMQESLDSPPIGRLVYSLIAHNI
jgi:hypothetical protein